AQGVPVCGGVAVEIRSHEHDADLRVDVAEHLPDAVARELRGRARCGPEGAKEMKSRRSSPRPAHAAEFAPSGTGRGYQGRAETTRIKPLSKGSPLSRRAPPLRTTHPRGPRRDPTTPAAR